MSNTGGVAENISCYNAAALDFLGAPACNLSEQAQTRAVFVNVVTVTNRNKNVFSQDAIHA
ncbi:predicted protein [Sclerotinia sclerotiorum 1980 UF-70]|uniref:Uncharacterized protein n=2 Tax=Sclerotinia sclerotiorum (strain ATCC 18683 / 1980 / Ss-1) TaxID=665079 RepID=A7EVV0_SCLS1|nr:predicted protein [Sclerotinia sclerotiorum 1980 UF-70]APA15721.1 hypothetical protein sscle_15g104910 [Sclerotinia sclerotiorum 1980 UF-70]EDN93592.1 predicted protein [Sclerotinia sclerotiorum 1980 UF-70]